MVGRCRFIELTVVFGKIKILTKATFKNLFWRLIVIAIILLVVAVDWVVVAVSRVVVAIISWIVVVAVSRVVVAIIGWIVVVAAVRVVVTIISWGVIIVASQRVVTSAIAVIGGSYIIRLQRRRLIRLRVFSRKC